MGTVSYPMYEFGEFAGTFSVETGMPYGWRATAKLVYPSRTHAFPLHANAEGYVSEPMMQLWLDERVIPRTRIGIETNLKAMGLTEYDQLAILKFTNGRGAHDDFWIDFSSPEHV